MCSHGQLSAGSGEGQSVQARIRGVGWSGRRRPIKEVGCQTQGRLELCALARPLPSEGSVHEAIHVERGVAAEHVVGGTAEASGEDAQCLALAVLGAKSVDEALAGRVLLKKEDGGLTDRPT